MLFGTRFAQWKLGLRLMEFESDCDSWQPVVCKRSMNERCRGFVV